MSDTKTYYFPNDDIVSLQLNIRCERALMRAGINTIKKLMVIATAGGLPSVYGLGTLNIAEIESKLKRVSVDITENQSDHQENLLRVVQWQKMFIENQIKIGLLNGHSKIFGKSILNWLQASDMPTLFQEFDLLASILSSSLNLCDELEYILSGFSPNYLKVLLLRYGYKALTLDASGLELSLTRERVRQISVKVKEKILLNVESITQARSVHELGKKPNLLKIQTVLLNAKDMGLDVTNRNWRKNSYTSGLIGSWKESQFSDIDPLNAVIAICNVLSDSNFHDVSIPTNLSYIVSLMDSEAQDLPAKIIHSLKNLPKELRKEIKRHTQFVGAVHSRWLAQETEKELEYITDVLLALGYKPIAKEWFVPQKNEDEDAGFELDKNQSFHHSVRKMFQFCGSLPIEEICSGLRHAVSRTSYTVPPPDVMVEILQLFGYKSEAGLYHYPGEMIEELSKGEELIFKCFNENGKVVHHSELAQTFIESELSFPSLHATLNRSPLFDRFETALYKIRGVSINTDDIERAQRESERVPVDPEINYEKNGKIIVKATLGILAVATGVIFSEQLPNLSGEWICYVHNKQLGKLMATENEFRHISDPMKMLNCQVGCRLKLVFNTWDRSVAISIEEEI